MEVCFKQNSGIYSNELILADDVMRYEYTVDHIKKGGELHYDALPTEYTYKQIHSYWIVKYISLIIFLVGICLAMGMSAKGSPVMSLMIIFCGISIVILPMSFWGSTPIVTYLQADPPIAILQDEQFPTIMKELNKRRCDALRKKYINIDFLASPSDEFWKFRYLRNEGIITEKECTEIINKLVAAQSKQTMLIS